MAATIYATQLLNGILTPVLLFKNISRGLVYLKRVEEALHSRAELVDGAFNVSSLYWMRQMRAMLARNSKKRKRAR